MLSGEGSLVGAAEQEQRLGEVDRSGVDDVEAFDRARRVVAVRVVAGDVEQGLRDRQRGAQLVGGVGREPLLFGDVRFEPRQHGVEGVGELAELVVAALELDPVGERPGRGHAGGVGDAGQRARACGRRGSSPRRRPNTSRNASTAAARGAKACRRSDRTGKTPVGRVGVDEERTVGDVAQQEQPHGGEQQGTGQHEEPGVAEGELEADAHTRRPIHARLPHVRVRSGVDAVADAGHRGDDARARRAACAAPRR